MKYIAREGAPFKKEDSQSIGEYVNKFKTPEDIYNDTVENKESPIRQYIEWDENKAAYAHQIQQIRNIVNHISVIIIRVQEQPETMTRAFVYTTTNDSGKEITPIMEALNDVDKKKQIIDDAWANLSGWVGRYNSYKEFNKIINAYKETAKEYKFETIAV